MKTGTTLEPKIKIPKIQAINNKLCATLSGGMDSFAVAHICCNNLKKLKNSSLHLLTFNYHQRHSIEILYAQKQVEHLIKRYPTVNIIHKTVNIDLGSGGISSLTNDDVDLPDIQHSAGEAQPSSYVPFRNLMFLTYLFNYAENNGISTICYGVTKVDSMAGYWDTSDTFIKLIKQIGYLNRTHTIDIVTPLLEFDKKDIVNIGIKLKIPYNISYTCYSGNTTCRASTPSSSLRLKGFINAGYKDPLSYDRDATLAQLYALNNCVDYPDFPDVIK